MIVLGKCKEIFHDDTLPSIKDLIQAKEPDNKASILAYLSSAQKGAAAAGIARDVITGEIIPGELCCYSDGKYLWRSDIIYYFDKYNIKLSEEFIKHALA